MEEHIQLQHHLYQQQQQQQQQHQQQQQQQQVSAVTPVLGVEAGDRFPQWSIQETMEFLVIRADLDRTFMETKRNKLLWEVISSKLREKGFNRNAEQCKCKWKNLVTRYKACETMEQDTTRQQFPFYTEMQSIFTARMHMKLWAEAAEGDPGPSKKTKSQGLIISSDEDEEEEDSEGEKRPRKKAKKAKIISSNNNNVSNTIIAMKEMLENFMKQQIEMEMQWKEAYEVREEERRRVETEWRFKMEELEKERLLMERIWREREEQRRVREEVRAEKRDALVNALLDKLRREDTNL